MTVGDAVIVALVAWGFSYWVRWNVNTMRGAYYCGVGLGVIFWLGCIEFCAG